jgi:hypothetical protein
MCGDEAEKQRRAKEEKNFIVRILCEKAESLS